MNLMTSEQRDEAGRAVGFSPAADAEGVLKAIRALKYADRQRTNPVAVGQALGAALGVVTRLLAVEAEHATTRATVARLVVANNRGDDFNLGDLASELEQAGIDLKNDYAEADDLARAAEQEGWL